MLMEREAAREYGCGRIRAAWPINARPIGRLPGDGADTNRDQLDHCMQQNIRPMPGWSRTAFVGGDKGRGCVRSGPA